MAALFLCSSLDKVKNYRQIVKCNLLRWRFRVLREGDSTVMRWWRYCDRAGKLIKIISAIMEIFLSPPAYSQTCRLDDSKWGNMEIWYVSWKKAIVLTGNTEKIRYDSYKKSHDRTFDVAIRCLNDNFSMNYSFCYSQSNLNTVECRRKLVKDKRHPWRFELFTEFLSIQLLLTVSCNFPISIRESLDEARPI